jgi:hypothetical protein
MLKIKIQQVSGDAVTLTVNPEVRLHYLKLFLRLGKSEPN